MVNDYWKKRRVEMFPWVDDWADPQDKMRHKHPKELSIADWLWFSEDAFKIIVYGIPANAIVWFSALAWFIYSRVRHPGVVAIWAVLMVIFALDLGKKVKNRASVKGMNLYDLKMRDLI